MYRGRPHPHLLCMNAATLAGMVSTVLFAVANLPMVVKAIRSGDLRSYSASALILGNVGNLVYTIYVLSLPVGPIWVLHGFYLTTMAIMLVLYASSSLHARRAARDAAGLAPPPSPGAKTAVRFGHG
jgi:uncharacterized protein with PQ loop repeat